MSPATSFCQVAKIKRIETKTSFSDEPICRDSCHQWVRGFELASVGSFRRFCPALVALFECRSSNRTAARNSSRVAAKRDPFGTFQTPGDVSPDFRRFVSARRWFAPDARADVGVRLRWSFRYQTLSLRGGTLPADHEASDERHSIHRGLRDRRQVVHLASIRGQACQGRPSSSTVSDASRVICRSNWIADFHAASIRANIIGSLNGCPESNSSNSSRYSGASSMSASDSDASQPSGHAVKHLKWSRMRRVGKAGMRSACCGKTAGTGAATGTATDEKFLALLRSEFGQWMIQPWIQNTGGLPFLTVQRC